MTHIKTKILSSVKKKDITMIPKWRFMLHSSLGIFGIGFIFLVAVFTLSLVLFLLSRYGFMYLPFFGFVATMHALEAIPLVLLLCTIALLVLIEILSRYYSFSFRRPLAITLLALTASVAGVSFVVSETPVHEYIREYAKEHHIERMSRMYDRPMSFKGNGSLDVLRGEVGTIGATSSVLRLFDGTTVLVYASTSIVRSLPVLHNGDDIVVFGTLTGNTFEVMHIRYAPQPLFGGPMHIRAGRHMMGGDGFDGRGGMMVK